MYQINIKWLLVIVAKLFRGNVITNLIMPVSRQHYPAEAAGVLSCPVLSCRLVVVVVVALVESVFTIRAIQSDKMSALVRKLDYYYY